MLKGANTASLAVIALNCCLVARADDLADRLQATLEAIPFIDTHCHIPAPADIQKRLADRDFQYDVDWVLGQSTYVAEFLGGKQWSQVKDRLRVNAHHAYYRPFVAAFRDLYGLGANEELNDQNSAVISARMDARHREPGWYREVLRRAGVDQIVWLQNEPKTQAEMPLELFHPMWNVDTHLVYLGGAPRKTEANNRDYALAATERRFKTPLGALDDMDALVDREIEKFFAAGGVGLKSTSAYFRDLNFPVAPDRAAAATAFDKIHSREPISLSEQQALEDYQMIRVLNVVARLKRPMQFHTGNQQQWNLVANSNPLGLNPLLYSGKWHDAKFVVLHGGYPYVGEAITLVRYFDNAYLDLAWMPLFSPAAAKQALAEALDMLDGKQLMIGSDAANLEELYGTVKVTRRLLAEVMAEKISSGYWTEEVALQAARRLLYQNAVELYGLQEPQDATAVQE